MNMARIVFIFFMLLLPGQVLALDLEMLFSPGELISGHAKLEGDCKNCHVRGRDTTQNRLCLDCHEKIDDDIKSMQGFHGGSKKTSADQCRTCHSDHKGRGAQIIWLDKDHFDHDLTDYRLKGGHRKVLCNDCHATKEKYRDAPSKCIDCHEKKDAHNGKLGKECENCHQPDAWGSDQFDHDKTKFKLRFSHQSVACNLCHVDNRYKKTPQQCVSCHAIKDVHKGRFGADCKQCHNEKKWSQSRFDHNKDTDYLIKGRHKTVACNACHSTRKRQSKRATKVRQCYDCHKLDDVHKNRNGKQCEQCHAEDSWTNSRFDHDAKTDFPLKGAHKKASCESCHQKDIRGKKTSMACYSCHKHQDVHKGQEGKTCDRCHNDSTWWLEDVRYDHDLSDYPLLGQHAVVSCESCHLSSAFKDVKKECVDCHRDDDIHEQTLGADCKQCHNPNDWLIWQFDHDQTDFKIEGAHENLHCSLCHVKPLQKGQKLKSRCIDCHRADDVHDGNFGTECSSCHLQSDFSTININ